MAFTQADLTAIENAIASGALRVKFSDREVEYRSMNDLCKARDVIKAAVDPTVAASTRCTFASFTKE
jgi:hypothetical protein